MSPDLISYVDLRAFAAEVGPASAVEASGDPYRDARRLLPMERGPVTVGVISLPPGTGSLDAVGEDEFIIVLDGDVTFSTSAVNFTVGTDRSAVLPAGTAFSWSTPRPTTIVFMRYETAGAEAATPSPATLIDEAAALQPSGAPLAELLIGPTPSCRNHTDFSSADGTFLCGTWDSTPYHRRPMFYRHHELMHLLEGAVTFEDEAGRSQTFGRGDVFIVKQGARCSWESREQVKKVYVIYRPAP